MMDLTKAFHYMPHDLLIAKLNAYGFGKSSLKPFYSYLHERKERVNIHSEFSTWKQILNGVPQGSVSGPLLFNIYINCLFLFVQKSDICNFADDNTLSISDISSRSMTDTKAVIRVQNKTIPESTKAKLLGVTIDENIIFCKFFIFTYFCSCCITDYK